MSQITQRQLQDVADRIQRVARMAGMYLSPEHAMLRAEAQLGVAEKPAPEVVKNTDKDAG